MRTFYFFLLLASLTITNRAASNSLIVVDAAGRAIGYYDGACNQVNTSYALYSLQGYYACIDGSSGSLSSEIVPPQYANGLGIGIYESGYISPDCIGPRLAYSTGTANGPFFGGFVIASLHNLAAYSPNDGALSTLTIISSNSVGGGTCQSLGAALEYAIPVFNNDITVTGLSNVNYSPPLRIQPMPDSALADVIFFDGFE
jgi:hypothetical protein